MHNNATVTRECLNPLHLMNGVSTWQNANGLHAVKQVLKALQACVGTKGDASNVHIWLQ